MKTQEEIIKIEMDRIDEFWKQRNLDQAKRFHYKDGIWFIRNDIELIVMKLFCYQETTSAEYSSFNCGVKVEFEFSIDPNSWASIVSSVSKHGETYETFNKALDFHGFNIKQP